MFNLKLIKVLFSLFLPLRSLVPVLHPTNLEHAFSQPTHFYLCFSKVLTTFQSVPA